MSRDTRLRLSLLLITVMVLIQAAAGLFARSLGLLADAGHNLTDAAAIVLSLAAVRLARRPPTEARSFGYHRGTILAAQANAAAILAVTAVLVMESLRRLAHPQPVRGGVVVSVAVVATIVNGLAAALLHDKGHDLNMRSARVHMAGDATASFGVALAGAVIVVTGRFYVLDPAVSIAVGTLITWQAVKLLRDTADVLLESTPAGLDLGALAGVMAGVTGVDDVHDVHAWSLSSDVRALSAHVVLGGHPTLEEAQAVGEEVKRAIAGPFTIAHATLELECETCIDGSADPCGMAGLHRPASGDGHR